MAVIKNKSLLFFLKMFIKVAWYIQLFGIAVLLILGGSVFFKDQEEVINIPISLEGDKYDKIDLTNSGFSEAYIQVSEGQLHFRPDNYKTWWIGITFLGILYLSYTLYITFFLKKVLNTLYKNFFFTVENAKWLKRIAILITLIAPLLYLLRIATNAFIATNFSIEGLMLTNEFDFILFFTGLLLLVISELFKIAASLQEESELTI